jgi:hypothetical protein
MISLDRYHKYWSQYEDQAPKPRIDHQGESPLTHTVINELSGDYVEYEYDPLDRLLYISYFLHHGDGNDEIVDCEVYYFDRNPIPDLRFTRI